MKTSLLLTVVLSSFAAGAAVALTATESLAGPAPARAPSVFKDGRYGYSIVPPDFPKGEKGSSGMGASFAGFPKNGFASNVSIVIQNINMTMDEYRELSGGQFKQLGLKVLSETKKKIGGKDAVLWEYEGESQERVLRWMSLAVADAGRIYLVTATATKADYESIAKEFKACLESFKLGE